VLDLMGIAVPKAMTGRSLVDSTADGGQTTG